MKKIDLLEILGLCRLVIIGSRRNGQYNGLCHILRTAVDVWLRNAGLTNSLSAAVLKTLVNDIIMAMFLSFYNEKFGENIVNTKEYLSFGELNNPTPLFCRDDMKNESLNAWYSKREQFLNDWEQTIGEREFHELKWRW
jgi:hypothetical protein